MTEPPQNCPWCGAPGQRHVNDTRFWKCGSHTLNDGEIFQDPNCQIKQRKRALRAAGVRVPAGGKAV
jgi:hypothetical protein